MPRDFADTFAARVHQGRARRRGARAVDAAVAARSRDRHRLDRATSCYRSSKEAEAPRRRHRRGRRPTIPTRRLRHHSVVESKLETIEGGAVGQRQRQLVDAGAHRVAGDDEAHALGLVGDGTRGRSTPRVRAPAGTWPTRCTMIGSAANIGSSMRIGPVTRAAVLGAPSARPLDARSRARSRRARAARLHLQPLAVAIEEPSCRRRPRTSTPARDAEREQPARRLHERIADAPKTLRRAAARPQSSRKRSADARVGARRRRSCLPRNSSMAATLSTTQSATKAATSRAATPTRRRSAPTEGRCRAPAAARRRRGGARRSRSRR